MLLEVFFLYHDICLWGEKVSQVLIGSVFCFRPCRYYFKSYYLNEIGIYVILILLCLTKIKDAWEWLSCYTNCLKCVNVPYFSCFVLVEQLSRWMANLNGFSNKDLNINISECSSSSVFQEMTVFSSFIET